ncbi:MAG: carboxymuconolactone decarboxylase family protein [Thermoanaerobaculia bacterium]
MNVRSHYLRATLLALVVLAAGGGLITANAEEQPGGDTYAEIEQMLGAVPSFFRAFPQAGIAGAWEEFKAIQLSPDTALSAKEKELIGLAVAAQIPCHYCVYGHTVFARANGATEQEIQEAIAMASITRHWSTVLNGSQIDMQAFRAEIDGIVRHAAERAAMQPAKTAP